MRRPQKVLLCEETVSLRGIRQFYRVVAPAEGVALPLSARGASSGTSGGEGDDGAGAAAAAADSDEAKQALLAAKVDALLELLARVSFHQVGRALRDGRDSRLPASPRAAASTDADSVHAARRVRCAAPHAAPTLPRCATPCAPPQAVVFCNRKPAAEWLAARLSAAGYPAAALTADLPQPVRIEALGALRDFKLRVLVATDVMARGVDLERVNLVALLDAPPDAATYVHRVGRTGRFGTRGVSVALVSAPELERLRGYLAEAHAGERGGDGLGALPAGGLVGARAQRWVGGRVGGWWVGGRPGE